MVEANDAQNTLLRTLTFFVLNPVTLLTRSLSEKLFSKS